MPAKCAAPRATAHLSQEYRTPAWEQRKLGELFEESDERASDREILSVSVANGIYPASESDRETNPGASLANYKVVHSGDVVYNSMRMWQGAVDASRYDGIVSPAYVVAKPNSEVYARFFARLLRQPMLLKQYQQVSQGNSKDTQVLKFDDFASIEISMPASENEQRQIGAFFDRLDSLITLHQRKYDKLCVLKKSMLDKMFPKGGSLYPEIRFAGFTDPWEQRKLGELFEEHSEKDRDDLPALTIIQGGGTVHRDESNRNLQFDRNSLSNYKVVDTGDFIVHLRSFEGGLEKATCCGLVSPAYHIFRGKNVDSDFYYLYFRSKRFIDADLKPHVYGIRDGRSIDIEGMKTIFIPWTNLAEQRRIGAFFDRLDSLITLHQRKYDKLCVLKKSMLDKMFPKGGSLYPEIRFAGFTDPWEQRKLGEVARRVTRKNENGDSDLPLTISAQYGLVDQRTFFNSQVASKDMSGYFLLHRGEFAYNKSTSTDSPWGAIKRLEKYDMGCVSTLYICFELLSGDPDFLVTYYETDRWYKSVQLIAAEGARNHGLLNIAPDDFFETQICIPKRIDEQRRIGAFFDRLDSLITLHQRKLELLRNIKKSMLDKMFV